MTTSNVSASIFPVIFLLPPSSFVTIPSVRLRPVRCPLNSSALCLILSRRKIQDAVSRDGLLRSAGVHKRLLARAGIATDVTLPCVSFGGPEPLRYDASITSINSRGGVCDQREEERSFQENAARTFGLPGLRANGDALDGGDGSRGPGDGGSSTSGRTEFPSRTPRGREDQRCVTPFACGNTGASASTSAASHGVCQASINHSSAAQKQRQYIAQQELQQPHSKCVAFTDPATTVTAVSVRGMVSSSGSRYPGESEERKITTETPLTTGTTLMAADLTSECKKKALAAERRAIFMTGVPTPHALRLNGEVMSLGLGKAGTAGVTETSEVYPEGTLANTSANLLPTQPQSSLQPPSPSPSALGTAAAAAIEATALVPGTTDSNIANAAIYSARETGGAWNCNSSGEINGGKEGPHGSVADSLAQGSSYMDTFGDVEMLRSNPLVGSGWCGGASVGVFPDASTFSSAASTTDGSTHQSEKMEISPGHREERRQGGNEKRGKREGMTSAEGEGSLRRKKRGRRTGSEGSPLENSNLESPIESNYASTPAGTRENGGKVRVDIRATSCSGDGGVRLLDAVTSFPFHRVNPHEVGEMSE